MKAKRWSKMNAPLALLLALLLILAPVQSFASSAQAKGNCKVGSPSYPTIQSAVDDTTCSRVDVPAGTFYENVTIDRDLTIQGKGEQTIVDGGGNGTVFIINGGTVDLQSMTITHGMGDLVGGGGIRHYGTLTVEHSTITNNAAYDGGGISNNGTVTTVLHSTITKNTASDHGGGIYNYGGTLNVTKSSITNNTPDDIYP